MTFHSSAFLLVQVSRHALRDVGLAAGAGPGVRLAARHGPGREAAVERGAQDLQATNIGTLCVMVQARDLLYCDDMRRRNKEGERERERDRGRERNINKR